MKIGYARVSTAEQNLDMQIRALEAAGAERIFTDQGVSGGAVVKPALKECVQLAREGDEIIVYRLDRLSRSLRDLIDIVERFGKLGLGFRSIHEQIETASPAGRLFFHMIGALAEFERDIIRQRTLDGMATARAAGKSVGRPASIGTEQWSMVKSLMTAEPPLSPADVARLLGVSRQAVHKRLKAEVEVAPVEG